MRVLFVGLGSIGTRHLKNLINYCNNSNVELTVHALRYSGSKPLNEEIQSHVALSFTSVPEYEFYDAVFITNPTNLHANTFKTLSEKSNAFFIEKPIFEHAEYSLEELGLTEKQKVYVASPMRWCSAYTELKKAIINKNIFSVRCICSSYLPGWRPNADYRKVYSSIKEMGGGVTLDLIHEWDYLCDLFGYPQKCIGMRGKFSELEINSDDLSVYIARYDKFLLELHLDYFGREYKREVEVFTQEGSIKADFGKSVITLADGAQINCAEDANRRYEREIEYFVKYVQGIETENINSPQRALEVLKIALGQNVKN